MTTVVDDRLVLRDALTDAVPNAAAAGPRELDRVVAGEEVRLDINPRAASLDVNAHLQEAFQFWQTYGPPFLQILGGLKTGLDLWNLLRPKRDDPEAERRVNELVDEVVSSHSDEKLDRAVIERATWRMLSRLKK